MDYDSRQQSYANFKRMMFNLICFFFAFKAPFSLAATVDPILSVWANEAIVSTYSFDAANIIERQKNIAKYFTSQGWINYTKALDSAKLKDIVQKNGYSVSSVALLPPEIKTLQANKEWQVTMPLLVLYKNKQHQQKQTLQIVITVVTAKSGEGVRGFAITSFSSVVTAPPCQCNDQHSTKTIV